MKYRLISLAVIVLMLTVAVAAQDFRMSENRYHQHLEAAKYTPCPDHGEEKFCSHLPLVLIDTGGQTIPGKLLDKQDAFEEPLYSTTEDGEETIRVQVSVL